jgi:hypothetical protein
MADFGNLPEALFSPSKVAYVSYVALTALKILPAPSLWMFLGLSVVFWFAEIAHNDYFRIRLNKSAERKS